MKVIVGNGPEAAVSQLALLHRISGIVSSDMALGKMLDELIGLVLSVTTCDACLVYLLEAGRDEIVLCASQLPHAGEIGQIRLKIGEGVTGWVAKHQSVVALTSRAWADPRFKSFASLPEDTYEAFLSVPLINSGKIIGVINVHHCQPHDHSAEEVALLSYVAEQMGGAISKARLSEQSQASLKKVELLAAVGHTINTEGYLDRILQVISEMVAETFDSPVCSIMIVDEDRQGTIDPRRAVLFSGIPAERADQDRRLAHRPGCSREAAGNGPRRRR
jgi:uroporphyrinogen-III synthase